MLEGVKKFKLQTIITQVNANQKETDKVIFKVGKKAELKVRSITGDKESQTNVDLFKIIIPNLYSSNNKSSKYTTPN